MANHAREITITAPARATLERLVRASTTPAGPSRRARAVLLMGDPTPFVWTKEPADIIKKAVRRR